MPYLISGGATEDMARIAFAAFEVFVKVGAAHGYDTEDIEKAREMLKTEFDGFGLDED